MTTVTIVPGPFALVSSGNTTKSFMLDGDDIQERANAALNPYWGNSATVIKRGLQGFGTQIEGNPYIVEVYESRVAAERALAS